MNGSIIERAVQALAEIEETQRKYHCWSAAVFNIKRTKAVIEAMRKPTEAMLRGVPDWDRAAYETMIDAAIAEGDTSGEKTGVAQPSEARTPSLPAPPGADANQQSKTGGGEEK